MPARWSRPRSRRASSSTGCWPSSSGTAACAGPRHRGVRPSAGERAGSHDPASPGPRARLRAATTPRRLARCRDSRERPGEAAGSPGGQMKHRYVVVEGPIGCGKTSLAQKLGQRLGAAMLLEDPKANPFLPQFYRDMRRYALPTQLFFLFQRVGQLEALKQPDLFEKPTVADFTLAKDPLFARLTLDDAEFQLYSRIYEHVR